MVGTSASIDAAQQSSISHQLVTHCLPTGCCSGQAVVHCKQKRILQFLVAVVHFGVVFFPGYHERMVMHCF